MTRPAGFSLALAAAWPVVPLGILAMCALRIPIFARAPLPIERYALHIQYVTQILLTCFFAPAAARSNSNLLIGILQSSFLLAVSMLLAEESAAKCIGCITCGAIWWMGLAGWCRLGTPQLTPPLVSTISFATVCVLGGAYYFEMEQNRTSPGLLVAAASVMVVAAFGCVLGSAKRAPSARSARVV